MASGPVCVTIFDEAEFPKAVLVAGPSEGTVVGPFCKNCGFSLTFHIEVTNRRTKQKVLGCPPPNGLNPMDPRCHACTLKAMRLAVGRAKHRRDCPEWKADLWP